MFSRARMRLRCYSEVLRQAERLGPKKAKKHRYRNRGLYDRIVIGPNRLPDTTNTPCKPEPESGRNVTRHWRRGHFRQVRCGPGRQPLQLRWIAPTLVNAGALTQEAPDKKRYRVR